MVKRPRLGEIVDDPAEPVSVTAAAANLKELGAFVRARRALLRPESASGRDSRRKTPGLRREELASLVGISSSWCARIETGRAGVPSRATLHAITQALNLEPTESRHVFELAGQSMPRSFQRDEADLSPTLEYAVLNLKGVAATVFDRYATPRCWNAIADAMFRWSSHADDFQRNAVVLGLTNEYYQDFFGADYERMAQAVIGMFRRGFTTAEPTLLARRVFEFGMGYPLFRSIWNQAIVADDFTELGPFVRSVPEVGELRLNYVDVIPAGRRDVFVRLISPVDQDALQKLLQLESIGSARPFAASTDEIPCRLS
jgi:transcriptional regulator with XRE-family HTH domain